MSNIVFNTQYTIPGGDTEEILRPKRSATFKVLPSFTTEKPPFIVRLEDFVYKNFGDSRFYIIKHEKSNVTYELDWSDAMIAIRFGWLELVRVEDVEK